MLAAVGKLDELAPHGWRTVVGQPELFGVLVEQTELVVLDTLHDASLGRAVLFGQCGTRERQETMT